LHAEDDDFGQAGALVRQVMDDAARTRLVANVVGHLEAGVSAPVLQRAITYWRSIERRSATASPKAQPAVDNACHVTVMLLASNALRDPRVPSGPARFD
jgi:catalase